MCCNVSPPCTSSPRTPEEGVRTAPSSCDDDELRNIPLEFVQDALVKLAPRILAGVDSLTPDLPGSIAAKDPLPLFLSCTFAPATSLPEGYAVRPTHVLSLRFESSPPPGSSAGATSAEPEHLIVPAHQPVWSARCRRIAHLMALSEAGGSPPPPPGLAGSDASPWSPSAASSAPPSQARSDRFDLPVIALPTPLPAAALFTFPLLHAYLHTASLPLDLPLAETATCSASSAARGSTDPIARTQEYEALWRMCQAFGIAESDEIYRWLTPRWQAACRVASVWDA